MSGLFDDLADYILSVFNMLNLFFIVGNFENPIRVQVLAVDVPEVPTTVFSSIDSLLAYFDDQVIQTSDFNLLMARNSSGLGQFFFSSGVLRLLADRVAGIADFCTVCDGNAARAVLLPVQDGSIIPTFDTALVYSTLVFPVTKITIACHPVNC